MTDPKRSARLLGLLGLTVLAVAFAWWVGHLSGDVFLVSDSGEPLPAVGAKVVLSRRSRERSLATFYLSKAYSKSWDQYQRDLDTVRQALMQHRESAETFRQKADLLEHLFCSDVRSQLTEHFRGQGVELRADREGKFNVRLLPGTYDIWVSGQAGSEHAEWLETTRVTWRSALRLVEPLCSYSAK
jgi:hypothetical protein